MACRSSSSMLCCFKFILVLSLLVIQSVQVVSKDQQDNGDTKHQGFARKETVNIGGNHEQFTKLRRDPLQAMMTSILREGNGAGPRPPVILIPGLIASRMVAWKPKKCKASKIEVQDLVWLNIQKVIETMTVDKNCWLDCLRLDVNGTDPKDCKLRPDEGLHAIGELSGGNLFIPSGTVVFTPLIHRLATEYGYDSNSIIGAPYDWRLSPRQLESRDSYFTSLKSKIEQAVQRHGKPSIVIAHSMGNNMFLYFCDWLQHHYNHHDSDSMNGRHMHWKTWLQTHIWGYVGFAAPLLGAPAALKSVISGHTFGLPVSDSQARDILMSFPSTHFLSPRSAVTGKVDYHMGDYDDPLVTFQADIRSCTVSASSMATLSSSSPTDIEADNNDTNCSVSFSTLPEEFRTKSFSVKDVETGEIYDWMAEKYQDPSMREKHNQWLTEYEDDVLKPIRSRPRRPPVQHVMMIYGIDIATEVGYLYRMPTTAAQQSKETKKANEDDVNETRTMTINKPVLIERYVEQSYGEHVLKQRQQQQATTSFNPFTGTDSTSTTAKAAATAVLETYSAATLALQDTISSTLQTLTSSMARSTTTSDVEALPNKNEQDSNGVPNSDILERLTETYTAATGHILKQAMVSLNNQAQAASKLLKLTTTETTAESGSTSVHYEVKKHTHQPSEGFSEEVREYITEISNTLAHLSHSSSDEKIHVLEEVDENVDTHTYRNIKAEAAVTSEEATTEKDVDAVSVANSNDESFVDDTKRVASLNSPELSIPPDEEKLIKDGNDPHRLSLSHKAEIFALLNKKGSVASSVPLLMPAIGMVSGSSKKLVRTSQFHHSGDNTVPYVSLSYAKAWLDQYDYCESDTSSIQSNKREKEDERFSIVNATNSIFRRFPRSLQTLFALASTPPPSSSKEPNNQDEQSHPQIEEGGIPECDKSIEVVSETDHKDDNTVNEVVKNAFTAALSAANNISHFLPNLPALPPLPASLKPFVNLRSKSDSNSVTESQKKKILDSVDANSDSLIKKWEEYRPARIHTAKHFLDNLPQHNKVIDPAVEFFFSEHSITGERTIIMEVSEVDHLEISKHSFVLDVMFEMILPGMAQDLYGFRAGPDDTTNHADTIH